MRVMLIEDDRETAEFIQRSLTELNWTVTWCDQPKDGILQLSTGSFDCVILDRMLPDMDGIAVVQLLRGAGVATPVLMLTARGGLDDRVAGLEAGADDYLGKPFAISELVARLRSIARRTPRAAEQTLYELDDLRLDRVARQASRSGTTLDLSPLEFKLLDCLLGHVNEVVTRTMLLEKVWGYRFDPKTSLVQTHMSRLRAKVDKPFATELIRTVRGSGYIIGET
ncbi:response regulator transcription factor [Loktanella sp. Alg231-35]|uniref:response regulator transcription factor n=1 Tax=Loktanella sp. Alg231-35 TaxID=1922220 RepID=UPI000D54D025|nr:response regulator transcription factor [Loktanella sp. Alg231-35]